MARDPGECSEGGTRGGRSRGACKKKSGGRGGLEVMWGAAGGGSLMLVGERGVAGRFSGKAGTGRGNWRCHPSAVGRKAPWRTPHGSVAVSSVSAAPGVGAGGRQEKQTCWGGNARGWWAAGRLRRPGPGPRYGFKNPTVMFHARVSG